MAEKVRRTTTHPHRKSRQERAPKPGPKIEEMTKERALLQLEALDLRLGAGVGAKRERRRLNDRITALGGI